MGRGAAEEGADEAANDVAREEDVVHRIKEESGAARDAAEANQERAKLAGAPVAIEDGACAVGEGFAKDCGAGAENDDGKGKACAIGDGKLERRAATEAGKRTREVERGRRAGGEENGIDIGVWRGGVHEGARENYKAGGGKNPSEGRGRSGRSA